MLYVAMQAEIMISSSMNAFLILIFLFRGRNSDICPQRLPAHSVYNSI
jgi:hypothetical protein